MASSSSRPSTAHPAPTGTGQLFWAFSWLALQGFGGVMAVVHRELVDRRRWLTEEEFLEDWAAAQILPGPNVVNLSIMIGERHFGARGALAALAGMVTLPLAVVVLLVVAYAGFSDLPAVAGALRGMGAVAAGLVAGVGLRLAQGLRQHPLGLLASALLASATFAAMALWRLPLFWVLPLIGLPACAWVWRRLPADTTQATP